MSSGRADRYRLTPRALNDLDDIWRFSAYTWSIDQADRYIDNLVSIFETIATMPALAHERKEFAPPVRIHALERHLIVYRIDADRVVVLRVLGAKQDWLAILKAADL